MSINYQELVPEKALGKEISRHIFQTYRAKTGLPHEIEQNIEHIKRLNPEYEYHLFDDEDIKAFILEYYGEVIWGYYQRIAPIYGAARADFFRWGVCTLTSSPPWTSPSRKSFALKINSS